MDFIHSPKPKPTRASMPVNVHLCPINEMARPDRDLTHPRQAGQSAGPSKSPAQHLWTSEEQPSIPPFTYSSIDTVTLCQSSLTQ